MNIINKKVRVVPYIPKLSELEFVWLAQTSLFLSIGIIANLASKPFPNLVGLE